MNSDLINLLSVCFTALTAVYACRAATQARKANEIIVKIKLRPLRLSLYKSVKDFLHFCSIYRTMPSLRGIQGTTDLAEKINTFKWEVEQHGSLDMPKVENLIKNTRERAWQLQRLLDRLAGVDAKPIDTESKTAEENVYAISEWFDKQKKELKNLFDPYLRIT